MNKKYEETDIQAIADTIREKTGTEQTYMVSDMASGVNEVYDAGKKERDKEWWDAYFAPMREGKPTPYMFAGGCWNGTTFYPTQDIKPSENAMGLFNRFSWNVAPRIDLAQRLEDCGVIIDLSQCSTVANAFTYCYVTRLPRLNVNSTKYSGLTELFNNAKLLVTIDEVVICNDGTNTFSSTFTGCSALKNVKFTGVIGRSISFSDCPLSLASMKSIISCLKDYSGTENEFTYTVTFSSACITALEAEGATAEYNGEACTWIDLINYKKWNS